MALKDDIGLIILDVEHTGGPFAEIVSIGIAHAGLHDPMNIIKSRISRNVEKPADMTWKELWQARGWDMPTYEWWEKDNKLDLLDSFQRESEESFTFDGRKLAIALNAELEKIERLYTTTVIVGDAPLVEPFMIGHLLSSHGFNHLGFTRAGEYRSGVDIDSWQHGSLKTGCTPFECDWASLNAERKKHIEPLRPSVTPYTHDPQDDAASILENTFATLEFDKNRWKKVLSKQGLVVG